MQWNSLVALALVAPSHALIRFGCSQLVVERLDPLVQPGVNPSSHVHQIIGGNSFKPNMTFPGHNLPGLSTCTTCQPADDFSNYWTANLYFRGSDGTYRRVRHKPNVGFDGQEGGMTVYYMQNGLADFQQQAKVTAFAPGFRMVVGDPTVTTLEGANRYPQVTYTCLQDINTRFPETKALPTAKCPAGIMVNVRFPTCWDGVNLDSPNHMAHMAYPSSGTFDSQGPCPASHPVRVPQILFETIFATEDYANQWPSNGQQPFVWSFGDTVGYGSHGDYVFGWKDDSLQRIMDEPCYVTCNSMRTQSMSAMNACKVSDVVGEEINTVRELPGRGSAGPGPTGGTTSVPPVGTTTPITTTSRPVTTTAPPANCAAKWGQCGGQGWTGATCCQSGSTCQAQNQWYSQCL